MRARHVATTIVFALTSLMLVFPWPFLVVFVDEDVLMPYAFFLGVLGLAALFNLVSGILLVVADEDAGRQDRSAVAWVLFLVLAGAVQFGAYAMASLQST